MSAAETPTLEQLLREHADMVIGRISVALPAKVVSYDGATQTALVQPSPRARRRVPDAPELEAFDLPMVADVPVLWASWAGGAAGVVGTLQAGDDVVLLICDRSITEWKQAVNAPYTPADIRRCNLTDALAFPGGHPPAAALDASARPLPSDPPDTVVVRGSVKLGSSAAGDRLVTEARLISALQALVATFNAHTHVSAAVGSPTAVPVPLQTAPSAGSLSSADARAT